MSFTYEEVATIFIQAVNIMVLVTSQHYLQFTITTEFHTTDRF